MPRTVVVLHHKLKADAPPDEMDVLVQAEAVADALKTLGYRASIVPLELGMKSFAARIERIKPVCAFNLVESLDGDGRLIHLACSVLDHIGVPYTGAGAEAMFITSNKVLAKRWMARSGIPTPEWVVPGKTVERKLPFPDSYIVKTLWEEASVGIDSESVKEAVSLEQLMASLEGRSRMLGKKCFAERYIDGREFNLSLLGGGVGPAVLPPAEIVFTFPDKRPKILDYKAKWDESSLEYKSTVRTFDFEKHDAALLEALGSIGRACWEAFDLRGYARVDFRVDDEGRPWVLEINANPCISPDSGFVAAAEAYGLSYPQVIERILLDTLKEESL